MGCIYVVGSCLIVSVYIVIFMYMSYMYMNVVGGIGICRPEVYFSQKYLHVVYTVYIYM